MTSYTNCVPIDVRRYISDRYRSGANVETILCSQLLNIYNWPYRQEGDVYEAFNEESEYIDDDDDEILEDSSDDGYVDYSDDTISEEDDYSHVETARMSDDATSHKTIEYSEYQGSEVDEDDDEDELYGYGSSRRNYWRRDVVELEDEDDEEEVQEEYYADDEDYATLERILYEDYANDSEYADATRSSVEMLNKKNKWTTWLRSLFCGSSKKAHEGVKRKRRIQSFFEIPQAR